MLKIVNLFLSSVYSNSCFNCIRLTIYNVGAVNYFGLIKCFFIVERCLACVHSKLISMYEQNQRLTQTQTTNHTFITCFCSKLLIDLCDRTL